MAKRVFISYDIDNDSHYKNLLLAWDANREFDFAFEDTSCDCSVNSTDAAAIKRVISQKIANSTHFLCLVGSKTYQSGWVTWEIEKAVELGKKIVAVKIDASNETPTALYGVGANWAMSFTFAAIKSALG